MADTDLNTLQLFRKAAQLRKELTQAIVALDASLSGNRLEKITPPRHEAISQRIQFALLVVEDTKEIDTNMLEKLRVDWEAAHR